MVAKNIKDMAAKLRLSGFNPIYRR